MPFLMECLFCSICSYSLIIHLTVVCKILITYDTWYFFYSETENDLNSITSQFNFEDSKDSKNKNMDKMVM